MLEKIKKQKWFDLKHCIIYGGLLVLLKLFLTMGLPIYAIGDSAYDDYLFIKLSKSVAAGDWLGTFNKRTLLKRPMFAIYLAVINKLNLSFRLSVILLYTIAILVLLVALGYVIKGNKAKLITFGLLLFSPVLIHSMFLQRVYRMAVMPAAIIFVIATLLGLYFSVLSKEEKKYKTVIWSVAAGFCFFFFWNLREDSIWLLPFFACALGIAATRLLAEFVTVRKNKTVEAETTKEASRRLLFGLLCLVIPILLSILGNNWVKWQNYKHYGVYTDSEMNESEFGKLMSTMYSVKSDDEFEYVNLTHSTLEKIIAASPTLQGMAIPVEAMYDSGWVMENGEIAGGYITYAFRDALEKAGHYTDAVDKEATCKQINDELKAAIAAGTLETEQEGLYAMSYLLGKKGANFDVLIPKFMESLKWVVTYERMEVNMLTSSGREEFLRNFEMMTNDLVVYPPEEKFALVGYGFAKDEAEELRFVVETADGAKTEFVKNLASNDVFEYYINQGIIYEDARACRFNEKLDFTAEEPLTLHVYLGEKEVETFDLWNLTQPMLENEDYVLCFDQAGIETTYDELANGGGVTLLADRMILKLYQLTAVLVCVLAVLGYVWLTFAAFFAKTAEGKKEKIRELWLIITGLLLSFLLVTAGVTYRYAEAVNSDGRDFYLASSYVTYQLFVMAVFLVDGFYLIPAYGNVVSKLTGKRKKA